MHSPHQIQCLQELGINFLQLKDSFAKIPPSETTALKTIEASSNAEEIQWSEIEQGGIDDLRVLFPELEVSGSVLKLTPTVSWQLVETETPEISHELITSNRPILLSAQQKSNIWQVLSAHVKTDE